MQIQLHKNARPMSALRQEIRDSKLINELARRYGLNRAKVRKWQERETVEDRSHRPANANRPATMPSIRPASNRASSTA